MLKPVNLCRSAISLVCVKHNCTLVDFSVSGSSLNANIWHQRLGHPSVKVLRQVLNLYNPSLNKGLEFCNACQYGKSHVLPCSILKPKLLYLWKSYTLIFGEQHQFLEVLGIDNIFMLSMIILVSHGYTLSNTNLKLLLHLNNSNFLSKKH